MPIREIRGSKSQPSPPTHPARPQGNTDTFVVNNRDPKPIVAHFPPILINKSLCASSVHISRYFEEHKDHYVHLMRETSRTRTWEPWCAFFVTAVEHQAQHNLTVAESIRSLYEEMKSRFAATLSSRWAAHALDFIFANPIFRNSRFAKDSGIPAATASRFTRLLQDEGLLQVVRPAAGQRPATYRFEPLMERVRV